MLALQISIAVIVALLVAWIAVIIVRALCFVPPRKESEKIAPVIVNTEKAASDLSEMIKCKTVSHIDKSLEDEAEFSRFETLLPTLFPEECIKK